MRDRERRKVWLLVKKKKNNEEGKEVDK